MGMTEGKKLAEAGEIWVCGACGKTWGGDRYDAPDTSCFLYANLCKIDSLVWTNEPTEERPDRGRVNDAASVDYDWTKADWPERKAEVERREAEGESA
jgi:hypothetical protein